MSNSWAESPMFKVEYLDSLEPIDKAIAELLARRERVAEGKWYVPPRTLVDKWAKQLEITPNLLHWIFRTFTQRQQVSRPSDIGDVQNIVPLMRRQSVNGCTYTLTHMEQYVTCSVVNLTAKLETPEAFEVSHLELSVTLSVDSKQYAVTPYGRQGGGSQLSARFLVVPTLPDNLEKVKLSLVPYGAPKSPPKVVHELEDYVDFS